MNQENKGWDRKGAMNFPTQVVRNVRRYFIFIRIVVKKRVATNEQPSTSQVSKTCAGLREMNLSKIFTSPSVALDLTEVDKKRVATNA